MRMLRELCRHNALCDIILTTTTWDDVEHAQCSRKGAGKNSNGMISQGSKALSFPFLNTPESAWATMSDHCLHPVHDRHAVQLQKEVVNLEQLNEAAETKIGKTLYGEPEVTEKATRSATKR
jgi:hypothetical protein